jgi:hypothetical protein
MLTRRAPLLDFGIATPVAPAVRLRPRRRRMGAAGHTAYMAPEQLEGRNVTHAAPLRFLAPCSTMVNGRRAFAGETPSGDRRGARLGSAAAGQRLADAAGARAPREDPSAKDPDGGGKRRGDIRRQPEWIVSTLSAPHAKAAGRSRGECACHGPSLVARRAQHLSPAVH